MTSLLKPAPKMNPAQECRTLQVNLPADTSVDIAFSNITLKVTEGIRNKRTKCILKGVSGVFKSGELTAIMGPSGAGKSSLLNSLTGFSTQGVSGKIRAGDSVCVLDDKVRDLRSLNAYRKKSCYILQDDRLNPLFTVAELMRFAADMKLGSAFPDKLKETVIKEVLETLGLTGHESTRCGSLSGGQRKRMSIAAELIDNPPVLFLDEPTTGLDSLTSSQCIGMLKKLARNGRTVVCTIHQPTATLYSMFDQVYILAEGMCIYNGSSNNTVPYLASFGLMCPKYHNPADYILEIANNEHGRLNDMLAKHCTQVDWNEKQQVCTIGLEEQAVDKISVMITPPNEFHKFWVLLKRSKTHQYRDWTVTHLKVLLHIMIGILLGLVFENIGNDGSKTLNNLGYALISSCYLVYTSLMPAVLRFPSELPVLKKENFNNWYNLKTYYAAALVTGMPLQIWYSFVYSAPSYFLSGQPQEWARFGMFVLVLSETTLLSDALGNIIGTCVNPINGTFIGAILTAVTLVFTGFLILLAHMNTFMRTISHLSFMKFAFQGLMLSLYSNDRTVLDCPETQVYCHYKYPKEIMNEFSVNPDDYWVIIGILTIEIVILRIIGYLTLRRIVKKSS